MAEKYDLLIDGRKRWRAASKDDVRAWLREYGEAHADDDPYAMHVQIRRLSHFAWLTGGRLADPGDFV